MDKIEEWKNKAPKLIAGNGDKDFSYVVKPDQLEELIQLVREQCRDDICHKIRYEFEGVMCMDSVESFIDDISINERGSQ